MSSSQDSETVQEPASGIVLRARQVSRSLQSVSHHIRMRGGVRAALAHYYAIWRKEGIHGMLRRGRRVVGREQSEESPDAYARWIETHDSIDDAKRAFLRARAQALVKQPLISILVPACSGDIASLRQTIESVRAQLYPHWELCIAGDASTSPEVAATLREYAASDRRIRFSPREEDGPASEAVTGEYVALLGHGDILPEHALCLVAQAIDAHPSARMFYSDEDRLTPEGARVAPYFKSDWNPQLFLVQDLFSHLGVYEAALMRQAGGLRETSGNNPEHDLALRCVEIAGHDAVRHIPHVLYHARIAQSTPTMPRAPAASAHAVDAHLARVGVKASVSRLGGDAGMLRVRYALPSPAPLVSIVIPTRDGVDLLRQCIESIFAKSTYPGFEIVVVDNGSVKPETLAYFDTLRARPNVRVVRDDRPFNFSALNNAAVALARGDFVCLLNNDIEVISPDWLEELVSIAALPGNGAVGACLWYPNDTLQHGGVVLGLGGIAGHMHYKIRRGAPGYFGRAMAAQNLSVVTAACLVIRKSIYEEVGGLDEELAVAFNDVDFCIRVREAGYRNVWTPHAELYHHESATRGTDMAPEKFQRFQREVRLMESRWGDVLLHDPAYNPNLSLDTSRPPFALADEPRIGQFD
ncbi:glycosyltransferase family 2 protein [Caballeronia ptereochthonis]|uniref:Glycosyl transferase family protein n=1 Tax=Caballeronia ptereochthonis TaxID=1777144 RepID=A0A158BID9_9BURK|nr:glycosyltransferase family 2 protein [Caballeronia ptereochthonis]SAK69546.1 glycosyl transferase family protein [Caballeronia ptereochthonis]